tara:strand:+ start:1253 stop:2371 length:1119 start_codon:yes stop_codon:yes gene_type:complete
MSRARTFADLATASEGTSLANRNMIGNGAFNIDQRNTTFTKTGSGGGKVIERWREGQSNVGQLSVEVARATDSPDTFPGSYSLKLQVKTPESSLAANEDMTLLTKIEGKDCQRLLYGTSGAKTATLSFWVKSSIAGTFAVGIYQEDGNDNISKPYTINSADTWEHKTITYPGNTMAAINDDNTTGLQIQWYISIGSNSTGGSNGDVWHEYTANKFAFGHVTNTHITTDESTFQLTGVQFELGDVATPFELLPIAEDLARCQRYFYKFLSTDIYGPLGATGMQINTNSTSGTMYQGMHPVTMRAAPTMAYGGTWTAEVAEGSAAFALTGSVRTSTLFWQSQEPIPTSGANSGDAAMVYSNNDNDAFFSGDAEL